MVDTEVGVNCVGGQPCLFVSLKHVLVWVKCSVCPVDLLSLAPPACFLLSAFGEGL